MERFWRNVRRLGEVWGRFWSGFLEVLERSWEVFFEEVLKILERSWEGFVKVFERFCRGF